MKTRRSAIATIAVVIYAHNNENTIQSVVHSVLKQRGAFSIDAITVINDGSTDQTEEKIKKLSSSYSIISQQLSLQKNGKTSYMQKIWRQNTCDYLLFIDADCTFSTGIALHEMLSALTNQRVVLVCGNPVRMRPHSFVQMAIHTWISIWFYTFVYIKNGNSVHTANEKVFMIRRSFARTLLLPKNIVFLSQYLYFHSMRTGFEFRFVKVAAVSYFSSITLEMYTREKYQKSQEIKKSEKQFGRGIYKEFRVPLGNKLRAISLVFFAHPLTTIMALLFKMWCIVLYEKGNIVSQATNGAKKNIHVQCT